MKKLYLFALAAMMFAACATDDTQDLRPMDAPETLTVGFEEDTRIQLQNGKTVWTKGDLLSVFYRSNANQKWQFQGETGERTGLLKRVSTPEATVQLSDVVVAYPYSEEYYINPKTCNIQAYLPATQSYLKDSFGLDGNLMVSASEYNQIYLKNVCGWLKLQLTGNGEMVQSITLKGNNGEQVAGSIYVDTETATATLAAETNGGYEDGVGGTLVFDDAILTEVTLNCGNGVALGAEPTAFYIALPPQTFEKGLTIEVACNDGSTMTKSTENAIAIERNTIQPMAAVEYEMDVPLNEIWYTATAKVEPYYPDEFGATITSNVWDSESGKGIITFNANVTKIGYYAFNKCEKLKTITIPDSVTSIGEWVFSYCTSLTSVNIPDSVTEIGKNAFYFCKSLISITIPDSVTSIENYAFQVCTSLTSVTIPDSIASIGSSAFSSCTSLTNVTIGNSVTTISSNAFYKCTSLASITIPDSVTSIGYQAFYNCTSLKTVYCKPTMPPTGDGSMFYNNASGRKIYVPASDDDSIINAYKAKEYWSDYASYIEEYDFSAEQ